MEAREYLRQLKQLNSYLSCLAEDLEATECEILPKSPTISPTTVYQSACNSDKTQESAVKLAALRDDIKETVKKYASIKTTALQLINAIPDNRYKTVLYQYYINDRTLEETAAEMNRSYQNICQLHKKALAEFQKQMDSLAV